jgi:hypothetical protein
MMKYGTIVAALLAAVSAQKMPGKMPGFTPPKNCVKFADIKDIPDPFYMFESGTADFHCDMGIAIPFGPVPSGCAKLEVIIGKSPAH